MNLLAHSSIKIIMATIFFVTNHCSQNNRDYGDLKLNEIQVIGSHNSYKQAIEDGLWQLLFEKDSSIAYSLQYEHPSLDSQLSLGLRNLEIDVFHDPKGGKFASPYGLDYSRNLGIELMEYDKENKLSKPGLKVFHIQDIDFRSNNLLFIDCLRSIKKWSDLNKSHVPIIITINAKDKKIDMENSVIPLSFNKSALDSIDLEIRSVFSESDLITPDFIRGNYNTLEEAVLKSGWPLIGLVRGRVMFVLDESGYKLESYLNEDKNLKGRAMFVNVKEGNPAAAFRIINNPVKDREYIKELVKKGYLVRTRADAGTREARIENYDRFNAAVESGAQIITTDYYLPSKMFESDYRVIFENGKFEKINHLLVDKDEIKFN